MCNALFTKKQMATVYGYGCIPYAAHRGGTGAGVVGAPSTPGAAILAAHESTGSIATGAPYTMMEFVPSYWTPKRFMIATPITPVVLTGDINPTAYAGPRPSVLSSFNPTGVHGWQGTLRKVNAPYQVLLGTPCNPEAYPPFSH